MFINKKASHLKRRPFNTKYKVVAIKKEEQVDEQPEEIAEVIEEKKPRIKKVVKDKPIAEEIE